MVSQEQYEVRRSVAHDVDWRFDAALTLAHETGHRIGAIRKLRWSDVDLERGIVRRRQIQRQDRHGARDTAHRGRRGGPGTGQEAQSWNRRRLGAPRSNPSAPCSRHLLRDWWKRGEERAGLKHEKGMGWHGLRRKFATELKHAPLKGLCVLGGWKSPQTVTQRKVLAGRAVLTSNRS